MAIGRVFINKLKRIDYLIARKATGSPAMLAEKLEISETTLFEYLSIMRECGAPIKYEKFRQSYYYEYEGNFAIEFICND